MFKIEQNDNGLIEMTRESGDTVVLNFFEFWELCRYGRQIDTEGEVKEYLEQCDNINGVDPNKILNDNELLQTIADDVIDKRIGYESGDDIWDVAVSVLKQRGVK